MLMHLRRRLPESIAYSTKATSVLSNAGRVGFSNLGNTCYMNAALQVLVNCEPLVAYILDCSAFLYGMVPHETFN